MIGVAEEQHGQPRRNEHERPSDPAGVVERTREPAEHEHCTESEQDQTDHEAGVGIAVALAHLAER